MSKKLSELAEKLGFSTDDLKGKIKELGFEISPKARVIDDELAELIVNEFKSVSAEEPSPSEDGTQDIAEIYDEMIAAQREREIVKTQRKKTAGKEDKSKKDIRLQSQNNIRPVSEIEIPETIAVKEFAEKTSINAAKIIGELMKNGILANINQIIDFETAQVIADDLGVKLKRKREVVTTADLLSGDISNLLKEDDASKLKERPPVVVVMGHVDHGKTKLLDTIRETNVVAGESGGITQHIGAYQVLKKGKLITFLDTPGHEAFTAMRARGAKVTDIAILVVAADEGIKPQTVEALNHARDAKVPIIVAINKIDKQEANIDRVKGELSEQGLQPEDWGGDTVIVPVSALTGQGINDLLDMVLLTAEMLNLKANPEREAVGTVIEAHLDHSLGPIATVLVNTGTLKIMNNVIVGNTYGRIKIMRDCSGKSLRMAGPSMPVRIAGLSETPKSGDILQVVSSEKLAKERAEELKLILKSQDDSKLTVTNQLISQLHTDKILKLIIKADTKGSLEAIKNAISKIKDEEVAVKVIHSQVGTVTESDIMMASASKGVVLAFHADFDSPLVGKVAEREGVTVKKYTVIYNLLEDIKMFLTGLLQPEELETVIGRAEVKKIFLTKKKEKVIGVRILSGKMQNKAKLRVVRGLNPDETNNVVGEGVIDSLKKIDEPVHELKEGNECGIKFIGTADLKEGDILEAYVLEKRERVIK